MYSRTPISVTAEAFLMFDKEEEEIHCLTLEKNRKLIKGDKTQYYNTGGGTFEVSSSETNA